MKKYPVLGVILPDKVKKELKKRSAKNGRSMSTEAARIIAKELGMEFAE
jgi:plasmid stability protein